MVLKNNKGFAMVIVLVLIVVLFLFSSALTVLINGQINSSTNNFKRIHAKYNAEAGIEHGITQFLNDSYTLGDEVNSADFDFNDNKWDFSDDYYTFTITKPDDYILDATGYYEGTERNITVEFEGGNFEQSFIYGNQFTVNIDEDLNYETTEQDEDSEYLIDNVDLTTYFDVVPSFTQLDSKDLYKDFITEFYSSYDGDNNGYIDGSESYPNYSTPPGGLETPDYGGSNTINYIINNKNEVLDGNGNEQKFDTGQIYHYRGNLKFSGKQQSELLDEYNLVQKSLSDYVYEEPPVIIVDGELEIDTLNAVRNFIFIVKEDITLKTSNAAHTNIDKTFIYTEKDFNYFLDSNNIDNQTDTPHMNLSGQIIAENNINIKIKQKSSSANNNDAEYDELDWPSIFDYSNPNSLDGNNFKIVQWIE